MRELLIQARVYVARAHKSVYTNALLNKIDAALKHDTCSAVEVTRRVGGISITERHEYSK